MSGDQLDFLQGNRETLTGTLHDPTATTGDVLTVQADKSIAAAPGGGSMPVPVTVAISSAQILALAETPVVIVPGIPGFVIMWSGYLVVYKAGSVPFTGFSPTSNLQLKRVQAQAMCGMTGVIDQATDQLAANGYGDSIDAAVDDEFGTYDGTDLVLNNQDIDPTDGNGTLIVSVLAWYAPIA